MSCRITQWFLLVPLFQAVVACSPTNPDENLAPSVFDQYVNTDEDVPVTIDGLARAHDFDGGTLTVSLANAPGHNVKITDKRHITVTPMKDFHGDFIVTYTVSDGTSSAIAHANVNVRSLNDTPVATGSTLTVRGNAMLTLQASDADGDVLTYSITRGPTHGTLVGNPPLLLYTPATNFFGDDAISFSVRDGLATGNATIQLNVSIGPEPIALSDFASGIEDLPLGLFLHAIDENGDPLTYTIATPPAHGALTGTPPSLTYTPEPNFAGSDSLQFFVRDATSSSSTATISINLQAVNDAPVANPQTVATTEDTPRAITLTGSDVDSPPPSFTLASSPSHGMLSGFPPNLTYVPAPNYHGPDSFTFVTSDFVLSSAPATVTIDVGSVEDSPVATAFSRTLPEDGSAALTLTGSDGDGDAIADFVVVASPAHGSLSGTAPALTYTPTANYNGPDSFSFTVSSGGIASAPGTVTLNVTPVNDAPVATSSTVTTAEDTPIAITLQASDIDNSSLGFSIIVPPADGTVTGSGANRTYTPARNANGSRTFTFRTSDGGAVSDATVTIEITPVNDPPTTSDDFVLTDPGTPITFDVAGNDSDPEGDPVTLVLDPDDAPAHGTAEVVDGQLRYTPAPGFTDTEVFVYTVVDSQGAASTGTAHVGVGTFPPGVPAEALLTVGGSTSSSEARRVPAISSDGRYIAFASALSLVANDANSVQDIYLIDRKTHALTRASVAAGGGDSNGTSLRPHLSADGRYVVFESTATNLVAGDTNGASDVFRYDRVTGATVRVSVATGGGQGTGASIDAEISDDGNLVTFSSTAFELVADDTNGAADIFVRDLAAGTTTRVSVGITIEADLASTEPAISGDGRYVAFSSLATNLVTGDTNGVSDVFVRDRIAGTTTRISVSSTNGQANQRSFGPSISQDGRFISYVSDATNLVPSLMAAAQVYVRATVPQTTTWSGVSSTSIWAQLSGDGRYLTLFNGSGGGVVIRDRFASITATPPGAGSWFWPMLSDNGRYLVVLDNSAGATSVRVLPNPL